MIDDDARARLVRRFGEAVTGWVDALPGLVAELTARWDLTLAEHVPGGTGATFLCTGAVLKLTPDLGVAALEARALTAWARTGAVVDLLDTDLPRGALLLERIHPGTPATDPARVVPHLHDAPPEGFPPLLARVDFLFETLLPRRTGTYYATEHRRARKLAQDNVTPVLLHGDMHPGNVLQGPHGPRAIDPRACVGDPAVDWCDFVHGGYDLHGADVDLDRVHEWLTAFAPFYG
ncbi:aminoglycoside phosphotransferase family protein [Lentzea sp. DG1S-22]|uniref:aminoglycoside phosphotransferase family protein n=1 Tax=Lentzea sp. DG1S-22 TaxID=3108822 RepID=UPI002E7A6570|nr:aminoglycoside phosphotransferase family protein [Lentzea sp. DG1S-22]WVH82565.1 aminoglycoside phosphotransferase family protein [Lentzea sp. DG1S-22]